MDMKLTEEIVKKYIDLIKKDNRDYLFCDYYMRLRLIKLLSNKAFIADFIKRQTFKRLYDLIDKLDVESEWKEEFSEEDFCVSAFLLEKIKNTEEEKSLSKRKDLQMVAMLSDKTVLRETVLYFNLISKGVLDSFLYNEDSVTGYNMLKKVYKSNPDIIYSSVAIRTNLQARLSDEVALLNTICFSVELGIPAKILKEEHIDNAKVQTYTKEIIHYYGTDEMLAEKVVLMWVEVLYSGSGDSLNAQLVIQAITDGLKKAVWIKPEKYITRSYGSLLFKIPKEWKFKHSGKGMYTYSPYSTDALGYIVLQRQELVTIDGRKDVEIKESDLPEELFKCARAMNAFFERYNYIDTSVKKNWVRVNGIQLISDIKMEGDAYISIFDGYLYTVLFSEQVSLCDVMIDFEQEFLDNVEWIAKDGSDRYKYMPLEELEIGVGIFNCLKRAGINTVGELTEYTCEEIMQVRNLSRKAFDKLSMVVKELGLSFKQESKSKMKESGVHTVIYDDFFGEELPISVRAYNRLKRAGINPNSELKDKTAENDVKFKYLSGKSKDEIMSKLRELGISFKEDDSTESNKENATVDPDDGYGSEDYEDEFGSEDYEDEFDSEDYEDEFDYGDDEE